MQCSTWQYVLTQPFISEDYEVQGKTWSVGRSYRPGKRLLESIFPKVIARQQKSLLPVPPVLC